MERPQQQKQEPKLINKWTTPTTTQLNLDLQEH